jgi:hypothetical protein
MARDWATDAKSALQTGSVIEPGPWNVRSFAIVATTRRSEKLTDNLPLALAFCNLLVNNS